MNKKLSLEIESLTVDSFTTSEAVDARGTVRGQVTPQPTPPQYADECTCNATCLCRTNAYYCATVMATVISCHYTYNDSCNYDTYTTCGGGGDSVEICEITKGC